jgi:ribulose-phosphate 3-epimerase
MIEIVPAILPKTFAELKNKLNLLGGLFRLVQLDLCDGLLTPSRTWPFAAVRSVVSEQLFKPLEKLKSWSDFSLEFDLMVTNPLNAIIWLDKLGFNRFVVHREAFGSPSDFFLIKEQVDNRVKIGLAISPAEDLASIDDFLTGADFIQVMGIRRIGFQGQPFDERAVQTTRFLRRRLKNFTITIDGGVNLANARILAEAGADRLVIGSALFSDPAGVAAALAKFKTAIN